MRTHNLTMRFSLVLTAVLTVGVARRAVAADDTDMPGVAREAPPLAASAASRDPNIDRGFLLPTAMTQPAGSLTYNNYELLLHGLTYAVTDRVQTSLTVLSPISRDIPFVGFGAVKGRLFSTDRFHLAAQGSLGWAHAFSDGSNGGGDVYTLGTGGFASYCLRDDCSSLISASATYQLAFASTADAGTLHLLVYGASIVHRVGRHVKLLGELATAAGKFETDGRLSNAPGVLASYGVRFHTGDIAADVGFIKPLSDEGDQIGLLMGLPFVNVSYRW